LSEEELRRLNPAVAATLSALKRGHSLTQLYTDYIQVVEDRDQLRLDKQRLTEYVKQLVDDVKENAPALREQQENYKRLKAQVSEMSIQLQSTNEKLDESQSRRQELERRAGYYQREAGRLKQTCADLSNQVQVLLREVELAKGTVLEDPTAGSHEEPVSSESFASLTHSSQLPDSSTMNAADVSQLLDGIGSTAANVIGDHLVTWRNLQELQLQNQRLLWVARDLANQLEQRERNEVETSKRVTELNTRVETLSGELEVVRLAARETRSEAQVLTRQRDICRSMLKRYDIHVSLDQETNRSLEQDTTVLTDSFAAHDDAVEKVQDKTLNTSLAASTVERLEETLSSLDAEFKRYREDKIESDKIYSSTIDQLRKESGEARLLNQKLASQLDFTHEKLRTMEANVSGYKQEITVLREMNARYSTSAASSEAEMTRLREELMRTSDKLLEVEVDARHSARELELSRANESRWRKEIEALRRQEQMHTQLMHQLEAIQGNLDRRDQTDRTSMERRISQLEMQLTESQSAFTEASQTSKAIKQTLEHELELAKQKAAAEEQEVSRLQEQLASLQREFETLKPKTDSVAGGSRDDESQLENDAERIRELSLRNLELQHELDAVNVRLKSVREQSDQMRNISEAAEARLNEMMEEGKLLEQRLTTEFNETKQRCEFLEAQLDLERKERQNLVNENIHTTEEAHKMTAELRRELNNIQNELEDAKARCESALELEAGAKSAIEAHERVAQEARAKYERELALHASDVESLAEARQQAEAAKAQLNELQSKLSTAETRADSVARELDMMSTSWDAERQELNEQLRQADKEQNLLQDQVIKLAQQIVSLRKLTEKTDEIGISSTVTETSQLESMDSGIGDLKTSEDLLQLVGYLRRQKCIAESASDAASAEISRLLLRISNLENQKDHLQNELESERRASELAAETSLRHSELMERVEQLNLVTESNRLLRHERETLQANLSAIEKQLRDLESTVVPLREENNELSAQVDSFTSEKRSLVEERDRWKERCNRLVETAQRMDPEQYRLACNERDESQRSLRRAEEEVQLYSSKLTELRTEMEERSRSFNAELNEAQAARQSAEQMCNEYSANCDTLRRDLENKETTVVKLREIGRKYRQEAETLRRQLTANRSDEAQLKSLSEALTEAKADLVTLKADLATSRSHVSQLSGDFIEAFQVLENIKSNELFRSVLQDVTISSAELFNNPTQAGQQLVQILRVVLNGLSSELGRLNNQAEEQRERLLRMQLVESQLTKSQRDCAELRSRLSDLQSAVTMATSVQTAAASVTMFTTPEPEPTDLSQTSQSYQCRGGIISPDVVAMGSVDTQMGDSLTTSTISSLSTQTVPAWILRAAATVQPVQPTPAVTPPNSVTGLKQTAEIRPITSNVATVVPTPALQFVQTTSIAAPIEPILTSSVSLIPITGTTTSESAVSSFVSCQPSDQMAHRLDQATGTTVRSIHPRRLNVTGQPQSVVDHSTVMAVTSGGFSWASTLPSSTSMVSVTGKRRLEDVGSVGSPSIEETLSTAVTSTSTVASPDPLRGLEGTQATTHASGFASVFSEAKRLRPTVSFVPGAQHQQAEPSAVVMERSAFGFSNTTLPLAHATASRLVAGQEETTDSCDSTTPNVYASEGIALSTTQLPCSEMEQSSRTTQQILPEVALTELPINTTSEDLTDVVQVAYSTTTASADYSLPSCSNENAPSVSELLEDPLCQPVSQFVSSEPADVSFEDESQTLKSSDAPLAGMLLNSDAIDYNPPLSEPGAPEEESMNAMEPSSDSQTGFLHSSAPLSNEMVAEEYQEEEDTGDEELETDELEKDVEDEELVEEEEEDVVVERERVEEYTRSRDSEGETDEGDLSDENDAADEVAESATGEIIELSSESSGRVTEDEGASESATADDIEGEIEERDQQEYAFDEEEDDHEEQGECADDSTTQLESQDVIDDFTEEQEEDEEEEGVQIKKSVMPVVKQGSRENLNEEHITPVSEGESKQSFLSDNQVPTRHSVFGAGASFSGHPRMGLFSGLHSTQSPPSGLFAAFRPAFSPSTSTEEKPTPSTTSFSGGPGLFKSSLLVTGSTAQSSIFKPSLFGTTVVTTTAAGDKSDTADVSCTKPKIQPIVWDAPESPPSVTTQPSAVEVPPTRVGAARRKKWGGPSAIRAGPFSSPIGGSSKPDTFGSSGRGGPSGSGIPSIRPGPRRG
ncbi:Nucleoprotein TPR, partial [Paragonimus heterotremus]